MVGKGRSVQSCSDLPLFDIAWQNGPLLALQNEQKGDGMRSYHPRQ
jgi:hypothetical protein